MLRTPVRVYTVPTIAFEDVTTFRADLFLDWLGYNLQRPVEPILIRIALSLFCKGFEFVELGLLTHET